LVTLADTTLVGHFCSNCRHYFERPLSWFFVHAAAECGRCGEIVDLRDPGFVAGLKAADDGYASQEARAPLTLIGRTTLEKV
jgi:hypothetical protein